MAGSSLDHTETHGTHNTRSMDVSDVSFGRKEEEQEGKKRERSERRSKNILNKLFTSIFGSVSKNCTTEHDLQSTQQ